MITVQIQGRKRARTRDVARPTAPKGMVLVQVMASGLCRSEMSGWRGVKKHESNEGHEAAGVVVETRGTRLWRVGNGVGIHAVWGCGTCDVCSRGQYTWCADRRIMERAHSEYLLAPAHAVCELPEDCPFDVGVLLTGCTFGHAFHGQRVLGTRPGEVVVILGQGPTGLSHTLVQSALGAEVVAVDVDGARLDLARSVGAAHVVNSAREDLVDAIRTITGGALAHRAIESAGSTETLHAALRCVRPAGHVLCSGELKTVPVPVGDQLVRRDVSLAGTWYWHYREYPEIVALWRRGLPVQRIITHRFPLEGAARAYREFDARHTGKVIFEPSRRPDQSSRRATRAAR